MTPAEAAPLKLRIRPALSPTALLDGEEVEISLPPSHVILNRYLAAELVHDEPTMIRSASLEPAEVEDAMQVALSNTLDTMHCEVRQAEVRIEHGPALRVWMMIGEPPWVTALALALAAGWWPDEEAPPEHILVAVPAKSLVLIASVPSVDPDAPRVAAFEKLAADAFAKSDDDEAIFHGAFVASPEGLVPIQDYGPPPTLDFTGSRMLSLDDLEPDFPAEVEQRVSAAVADFIGSGAADELSEGVGMYLAAAWCGGASRLCADEWSRIIPETLPDSAVPQAFLALRDAVASGETARIDQAARVLQQHAAAKVRADDPGVEVVAYPSLMPLDDAVPEGAPQLPVVDGPHTLASAFRVACSLLETVRQLFLERREFEAQAEAWAACIDTTQQQMLLDDAKLGVVPAALMAFDAHVGSAMPGSVVHARLARARHLLTPLVTALPWIEFDELPYEILGQQLTRAHYAEVELRHAVRKQSGEPTTDSVALMRLDCDAARARAAAPGHAPDLERLQEAVARCAALEKAVASGKERKTRAGLQSVITLMSSIEDDAPVEFAWTRRVANALVDEAVDDACRSLGLDRETVMRDAAAGTLAKRAWGGTRFRLFS